MIFFYRALALKALLLAILLELRLLLVLQNIAGLVGIGTVRGLTYSNSYLLQFHIKYWMRPSTSPFYDV